ncbi:MAG: yviE [Firmicutes bacterium]|nr:yviE [Bacillota bacterium]
MLRINISQQYAQISINSERADMGLNATLPKISMETEAATLEIHQPKGELKIDGTPFRASYGLKTNSQFSRDNAARSRQIATAAIGRIVEDGNRMAQIGPRAGNAIVELSKQSILEPTPEVKLAYLQPPDIHFTEHQPEINYTPGKVDTKFQRGDVGMDYQAAQVDIRLDPYPSISIWVTDSSVDIGA